MEGLACSDQRARTPIGASRIAYVHVTHVEMCIQCSCIFVAFTGKEQLSVRVRVGGYTGDISDKGNRLSILSGFPQRMTVVLMQGLKGSLCRFWAAEVAQRRAA